MVQNAQNGWSPAIEAMHAQGIRVLLVFGTETEENRAKLADACRNIECIEKIELRLKELLEACELAAFTGKAWQDAQKQMNCLFKRTRKFQRDTYEFGWSPLARVLLVQKYRRLKLRDQKDVSENNPMERFLREHCTLGMDPQDPTADAQDPLETLLNDEW